VLSLEGGYNLEALGAAVVASLRVLSGGQVGSDPLGSVRAKEADSEGVVQIVKRSHPLLR
jgi:acetoin utilization deacetylase AcuC-like enzyme